MGKILPIAVILLFIGVALAPTFSSAVTPSTTTTYDGSLSGYVNDTNMDPIDGARVRVHFHGTYEEDYTDSTGYYHVTNIPICYCLKNATASKEGYETEWILLSITENTTHDFVLTSLDPIPDLECDGSLSWTDIEPGATLTGTFTVENIGEEGSLLDWEIESYPDWGTWTFDPDGGTGLPKGAPVTVDVEVVAPDDLNEEFTGEIKIVNLQDPDDYCIINIAIAPIINANDKEINDDTTEPLDVGRTIIRGFGLFPHYHGDNFTFFALRCHYITITGTSRTTGTIHFRWISTSMPFGYYKEGLLGILIYVFGMRLDDDFEPPDSIMRINN